MSQQTMFQLLIDAIAGGGGGGRGEGDSLADDWHAEDGGSSSSLSFVVNRQMSFVDGRRLRSF